MLPSLLSSLRPRVHRTRPAKRAQAALAQRKSTAESQTWTRLKRSIKHQSPKIQSYTYSPGKIMYDYGARVSLYRI